MDYFHWRNQTRSDAIQSWENEGGALAREPMTAWPMDRLIVPECSRPPSVCKFEPE